MFELNPDFPDATSEQKWKQFKQWRLAQLTNTDWTQTLDAPLTKSEQAEFAAYRKFLRDAPANYKNVEDIEFLHQLMFADRKVTLKKLTKPYKAKMEQ